MTTTLIVVAIIAELVLIVFARIGFKKVRADWFGHTDSYVPHVWPMDTNVDRAMDTNVDRRVQAITHNYGPSPSAPAPALARKPLLALPPPKPKRRLPSY